MLKQFPFIGDFPIIQHFGDNPEIYRQFNIDGIPLRGHNGIDYALPFGRPVLSVEDGAVLQTGNDVTGFGQYILLGHTWGQTLYAHLSESSVQRGTQVSAGQQIGLSGSSGTGSQPHLHFGLRIHPFSVHDGWGGYSDPQAYLDRISRPLGPIIGPHIIGGIDTELLRRWQPRMVLVMDPNPDEMRRLRQTCPNTVIVGRVFATDQEISGRIKQNPEDAAQWAHSKIMERMNPSVDYWQFANEVLQGKDELPLLTRFEIRRMQLAEESGYRCAIFAFSVGNPDLPENDRMGCWELTYPAIERAEQNDHIIAIHQYGAPSLLTSPELTDWLILRLEHQLLRRLPYKKVKFAVTEYGIDGMIQGGSPAGWQKFTSVDGYVEQLLEIGRYTERFSGRILGYAVFTLGHNNPWGSYDIADQVADALAAQSQRGTWRDISVAANRLGSSDSDTTTEPGSGGVGPSQPVPPTEPPIEPTDPGQPEPPEPTPPDPGEGEGDDSAPEEGTSGAKSGRIPEIDRRVSEWVLALNMRTHTIAERPDFDQTLQPGDVVCLIKDIFTTANGSWEPSTEANSVPQWARESYLKAADDPNWFDDAGADHHLFCALIGLDGQLMRNQEILYWSDGFERLGDPGYDGYIAAQTKERSGWANLPLSAGSSFVPERGESGPWCCAPDGASEVFVGGGLPSSHHVSTFVVWQAVRVEELPEDGPGDVPAEPPVPPVPTPPPTPPPESPPVSPPVERRIGQWADDFNMSIRPFHARPDAATLLDDEGLNGEDVVYVLKDLFTTRNGSWEGSDKPGSVPEWAHEYLRPVGAPDFFDDAGGDHHLFAAVIGLDGRYIPQKRIIFWSDGIDKLADAGYQGYVHRETKERSGWINIPIGPGSSFVPERGESGPWCWAPTGAADVICGGGLPAKQHVSTFAVWQAIRREDLPEERPDEGKSEGRTIFLPFIRAGVTDPSAQSGSGSAEIPDPIIQSGLSSGMMQNLRAAAWQSIGIEGKVDSPLAQYARQHELGMPVTEEFSVQDYLVQGFQLGIVYVRSGDIENVAHCQW